jgi:hypothetical protein
MDRQMTAFERKEFDRINAEIETGQLITKLRKTNLVSKLSQIGLAASLVLSLGFLLIEGSSTATAGAANHSVAVQQDDSSNQIQHVALASFKMSTELGSYSTK